MKRYNRKKQVLFLSLFLTIGVVFLFLPSVFSNYPKEAEYYARHIFPVLSKPLVFFASLLPFSLTEILLYILVIGLPVGGVFLLIRFIKSKNKLDFVTRFFFSFSIFFLVLSFAFSSMMGMNYSRYPLSDRLFPEKRERSKEELLEVTMWLAEMTSELRLLQAEDEHGIMTLDSSLSAALVEGSTAMNAAAEVFPILAGNDAKGKSVMISKYWSYTGITGMYMPFLGEANVNTDVPAIGLLHTICHELSHIRGIAREQDANLAGFLACIYSPRVDFQYSGYQFAYVYCASDLYRADEEAYAKVAALISDGVWRDWANRTSYWKQFEGPVQEVSTQVNDTYLQANRQKEGVLSYSMVTELIVEYYFSYVKGA